jgi:UDP-3-O-[3-hydroxymyristoyl] N-acetylglucosamine deacetylase
MHRVADGPRHTLAAPVERHGVGLHGGRACGARLEPAPPDHGLRLNGTPVHLDAVEGSAYATTLRTARGPVQTAEHLLAALAGRRIDDADIWVEGGEVPILDGSAGPWFEAIVPRPQGGTRWLYVVDAPLTVEAGASRVVVTPAAVLTVQVHLAFPALSAQSYSAPASAFAAAAGARTFGFLHQAHALRAQGLIGGAGLDNVLVFDGAGQVQNPHGARWPDEPARHKWVDLLGDLSLFGDPLRASIVATRAGHAIHHALVGALLTRRSS